MKTSAIKFTLMVLVLGLAFTSCKKKVAGEKAQTGEATGNAAVAGADAAAYTINAAKSKVYWTGSKPAGKHMGTINVKQGSIKSSGADISAGKFELDMTSLECTDLKPGEGKEDLEGHLKGITDENSDHFFNVSKYPSATFVITKVEKATGDATHNITGDLTLKGTTKSITFPANVVVAGDKISAIAPAFKINRTEWGVNYGSKSIFKDLKDKFVNDEVALTIELEANKG